MRVAYPGEWLEAIENERKYLMKKLIFLLLITASCSPYQRMNKSVMMRYSVGIYYKENFEGSILCKDINL